MEQHPVPQNVTTFQFRLIGDMTIKQFGYLAGGALAAYICYKLPLPFFFTWPLTITAGMLGFGLAFVPIEERPMDVWILSFLKNVYSPTQFIWQKGTALPEPTTPMAPPPPIPPRTVPSASPIPQTPNPQRDVLQDLFKPKKPDQSFSKQKIKVSPFAMLADLFKLSHQQTGQPAVFPTVQAIPIPSVTGQHLPPSTTTPTETTPAASPTLTQETKTDSQTAELTAKLKTLEQELQTKSLSDARVMDLQKQLTEALATKEKMEQELLTLRRQQTAPTAPSIPTVQAQPATAPHPPSVRIVTPDIAPKIGLPKLTTFPNVVSGIIKNQYGDLIPGILVTVRDKDDVPLRALKTNKLGQFAASTPLPNATYVVEIEDPRKEHLFDRIQITLNGTVAPALEIHAKTQKELNRAQLERAIFGGNQD